MSIGNGLSFAQAAALAGISPTNVSLLFGSTNTGDSTTGNSVNGLNNSRSYVPPAYTPIPGFGNINQVTGNGFGSSTSNFYTPTNSLFSGNDLGANNLFQLPAVTTPGDATGGGGNAFTIAGTATSRDVSTLPPVDKSALLNISADATPAGKVKLGSDPSA